MNADPDDLLAGQDCGVTISRACEILGYSRWTVERMIRGGELQAYGAGRKKRIHLSSILQYRNSSRAVTDREISTLKEIKRVSRRHRQAMSKLEDLLK
jgi:excisionase family DNA binding protein